MAHKKNNKDEKSHSTNTETELNNSETINTETFADVSAKEGCDCIDQDDEITLLKRIIEDMKDKHLRLQAEFDNYRKRTLREKSDLIKNGGESVLVSMLPVMDDFDRAYSHIDAATDVDSFKEGFMLIYNKMKDFLSQQGVKEFGHEPNDFDTEYHEAITKIPALSDDMKGKVVHCIQKGYTLNDKVVRYAKVVVGE